MAFAPTAVDIEPPFGPAIVKRGLPLQFVVQSRNALTGLWSGKDISAARWTYRVRAWTSDDDAALLINEALTKGTDSASGEIDHYQACGATVRDTLRWEIVEVDGSNADATTSTGYRERVLWRWSQPIIDAP